MSSSSEVAWRRFSVWFWSFALAFLGGCRDVDDQHELLAVADAAPRQIELGDRIEVVGEGFPEGRSGRVELSGTLNHAGNPVHRRYERSFAARASGPNSLSFLPSEAELAELVGAGDEATHTTFRGELRVVFGSRTTSGPVFGRLSNVVIDVFPWDLPKSVRESRTREAAHFAEFLGLTLTKGSFEVALVKPRSRAERAGIRGGDRLLTLDRVNLKTASDFVASGEGHTAQLELARGRLKTPIVRQIDVAGFRPVAPERLGAAALLVGSVACLWLLFCAPLARVMTFLERSIVQRLLEGRRASSFWPPGARARRAGLLEGDLPQTALLGGSLRPLPYLVFLAVSAAFICIALGHSLVNPELDVPCLFLAGALLRVCATSVAGGFNRGPSWSLVEGIKAALLAFSLQIPALLGIGAVFAQVGTLRPEQLALAQGLLPWHYHLFKSPMMVVACAVLLLGSLPDSSRASFGERGFVATPRAHATLRSLILVAESAHLMVTSGLCALLFLGGFGTNVDSWQAARGTWTLAAGALLLQLKTLLLMGSVSVVRWATRRVAPADLIGLCVRWVLPVASGSLVLAALYQRGIARHAVLRDAQSGISMGVFVLVIVALTFFGTRVIRALRGGRSKHAEFSMNPWL